jgi:predicted DsbA family dithiol-disulfide isomerase
MGPEWMHAGHLSGVDIDNSIWITDPPSSSFPACIAVKSAELQSKESGARYLYLLREAVMLKCRNIARTAVLLELASDLSGTDPSFDPFLFRQDLLSGKGLEAFKTDWQETKYRGITRFPTFVLKSPAHNPTLLSGFHTFDSLLKAIL